MEEKVYKTMRGTGVTSMVVGVLCIVVGVASDVLMLISGSKLLSRKSDILF